LVDAGPMKRLVVLSCLLIFGCHHRQSQLSDGQIKRIRALSPGITSACVERIRWGGIRAMPDTEHCMGMSSEKHWSGLWRTYFENDRFCKALAKDCNAKSAGTWVSLEAKVVPRVVLDAASPNGLYAVEVIGKETLDADYLENVPKKRLVVHRFVSIKPIGTFPQIDDQPAPPRTKTEIVKYWKACEAAGTCQPNWSEINKEKW